MSNFEGADSNQLETLGDGDAVKFKGSKKGTFSQGLKSIAFAFCAIMVMRWALWEPYLIPSGSMIPTFLINDHILVNKLVYGIRVPFTSQWLVRFKSPQRGDVIVFRSKEDPGFFLIKRIVAVGGDQVEYSQGKLIVNGVIVTPEAALSSQDFQLRAKDFNGPGEISDYEPLQEQLDSTKYVTLLRKRVYHKDSEVQIVPERELFVMGDNRDNSNDSRYWGTVSVDNVLGRAMFVWLSCSKSSEGVSFACSPEEIRWNRFFHMIH